MRIAIRVDSSSDIGTGHVMRCLALARTLRESGAQIEFVCREHHGNIIALIDADPFVTHRLAVRSATSVSARALGEYADWVGTDVVIDATETIQALMRHDSGMPDLLIVDHYGLDATWEQQVRSHVGTMLAIDDLANRRHNCDILLDQNLIESNDSHYRQLVPADCDLLLGPAYALLRSEFPLTRKNVAPRSGNVASGLIYFGGVDKTGETVKAIDAVKSCHHQGFHVDVVVGSANPRKEEIGALCRRCGYTFHSPAACMASLMARADIAIGAAGTTSWERCCLGLPTLMTSIAANQIEIAKRIENAGAARFLGSSERVTTDMLRLALDHLLSDPQALREMSVSGMQLVDGLGAERVKEKVMSAVNRRVCV